MKPVFVIRPAGEAEKPPTVELLMEQPATDKLTDAIVRPLPLCKDSLPIFQRTRGMVPSLDPVLVTLCLAGWQMRAKPEECVPKKNQWHVQVMTTLIGLKSFAFPFYVGETGLLGVASPFRNNGESILRARLPLEGIEPERLPYAGFFGPLQTMKFEKTFGIYMLANHCVMAGWGD